MKNPFEENFHESFEIEGNLPNTSILMDTQEDLEESSVSLELYNHQLTFEENFQLNQEPKYILVEVNALGNMSVSDNEKFDSPLSPVDKIVVNMEDYTTHGFDYVMVDYNSIFGMRFLTFMQYNSTFMACDERVFFEALLIKFKKSGYTSFYWSKTMIFDELGIKKDRASKIISRFEKLGIMKMELKTSLSKDKTPQQVNYFYLDASKIVELLPEMFKGSELVESITPLHRDVVKYLQPAIKNKQKKTSGGIQSIKDSFINF